ncbi:MAG: efflux RND transporter periplasmic adaptor subunit [Desulfobacteraceae bacterium]|nr:MAG: efflux RND transporter periplasmic adaptor subunit [Desulfobacteraceae bacterium]
MRYLEPLVLVVISVMVVAACGDRAQEQPAKVIRPVRTMTVTTGSVDTGRTFSGVSKAGSVSRISFRLGGKLEGILVKEGDTIRKNALIASLDASDATLQYEKTLSSVNKSKVYMETATSNLSRLRSLYENNSVSLNEYEAAKEKLANAKATYLADKKTLDLKKKELGYYKVHAPMAGRISNVSVEEGENLTAGQVILEIHSMDSMEVLVGIPDAYISGIQKDDRVSLSFTAIGDRTFNGKITEVSFNIDTESSTYPVTIEILDPSDAIRPGMSAALHVAFKSEQSVSHPMVPVHSVGEDTGGRFLYVVKSKGEGLGIIERKAVKIGRMTNQGFEILEGVSIGDRVVTAGINHLSDGLEVKIQ